MLLAELGSIDRGGFSRRSLELIGSRNQAVEPGHRAAVILLGNAREKLGDAVGSSRQSCSLFSFSPADSENSTIFAISGTSGAAFAAAASCLRARSARLAISNA